MSQKSVKHAAARLLVLILSSAAALPRPAVAEDTADARKRLNEDIEYFTSDAAQEGRGTGRRGLDLAADYIGAQFGKCGLKTAWYDGTPFQKYVGAVAVKMGPNNRLALLGPSENKGKRKRVELVLGLDYMPLAAGGSGKVDSPLLFAGYGITDVAKQYDDFGEIDVAGKTPIIFMGYDHREMIEKIRERVKKIKDLNPNAMIFVMNDSLSREYVAAYRGAWEESLERLIGEIKEFKKVDSPTPREIESQMERLDHSMKSIHVWQQRLNDSLEHVLSFDSNGWDEVHPGYPILRFRRSVIDRILKSTAQPDLMTLERQIDADRKPHSRELAGWSVVGEVEVLREYFQEKNVVAVLEGVGSLAEETIVFGAHYDALLDIPETPMPCRPPYDYPTFLGHSPAEPRPHPIAQGANDNASGVAVMLEVTRSVAQLKQNPRRRIVFIAFAGEELGMLGSKSYVRHPLFPLEKTVAMINLDMVGRLQSDGLNAAGAALPGHFSELLDRTNQPHGFQIRKYHARPFGGDQAPFHAKGIPTLRFSTGHDDTINTPKDRAERLNMDGMQRIARFLTEFVTALAVDPKRPEFTKAPNEPKR